jgi:hypothetical protein
MLQRLALSFPRYPGDGLDPLPPRTPGRRPKGKAVRVGMLVYYPDDPDWPEEPTFWVSGNPRNPFDQIIYCPIAPHCRRSAVPTEVARISRVPSALASATSAAQHHSRFARRRCG